MDVSSSAVATHGDNLSVLVVDDEVAITRHLSDGLAALGYRVRVAASGFVAKEMLTSYPDIGVLLTDVRMPGMDGLMLSACVSRDAAAPDACEVVLMSGHASLHDVQAPAIDAGGTRFLRKPFRLAEAAAAVEDALAVARMRRAGAAAPGG